MTTQGNEEQLAINVIAKLHDLEKQMAKAQGITAKAFREMTLTTNKATRQMERDAARSAERINSAMATVGTRIGAVGRSFVMAAMTAFSVAKVLEASQAYLRASNALKVAGISGQALADTFERLYSIAQANSAPIETLVGLYSKAAQAQKALGASSDQLLGFTTVTAQALKVSGRSAEESAGALLQLGQALTSGTVHAEEYNSMLEGAYPILQAAAAGIKEAGGEVSKLTALVKDGEVSSRAFFYGVLAGAPVLTEKLADTTKTVGQAWTQLSNAIVKVTGDVDAATGGTAGLVSVMDDLTHSLDKNSAGFAAWANELKTNVLGTLGPIAEALRRIHGMMLALQNIGLDAAKDLPQDVIDAFPEFKAMGLKSNSNPWVTSGGFGGDAPPDIQDVRDKNRRAAYRKAFRSSKPISLEDYPADEKDKDKGKTGGADTVNAYEREVAAVQKKIEALRVEAETVGMTAYEQDKAKEVQRLVSAAKEAEIPITAELKDKIDKLAGTYAAVAEKARSAKAEHDKLVESADQLRDAFKDVTKGFVSDLMHGKSAAEALSNALMKMADKILDKAMDAIVSGLFGKSGSAIGGGGGGIFGSLLGSLFKLFSADGSVFTAGGVHAFANGGAFTNSIVSKSTMFKFADGIGLMGEAGPEAIMPLSRDKNGRLGVQAAGGAAQTAATQIHTTVGVAVDDDGSIRAYVKKHTAAVMSAVPAVAAQVASAGISQFSQSVLPGRLSEINMRGG